MRLTVFDCEDDEASAFRSLSPRFHIEADITKLPVSQYSIQRNLHSSCISVGHKSRITASDLEALRAAGVSCIITRSIGTDHIDTDAAARLGITIQNTPYAPGGVAEYTVMLILMAIRGIRPVLLRTAQNDWRLNTGRGKELRDMTVGIIGADASVVPLQSGFLRLAAASCSVMRTIRQTAFRCAIFCGRATSSPFMLR